LKKIKEEEKKVVEEIRKKGIDVKEPLKLK
jgi:hypothetical protein